MTKLSCFEIELLTSTSFEQSSLSLSTNDIISNQTNNMSISTSAISIKYSARSSIVVNILTSIFILVLRLL